MPLSVRLRLKSGKKFRKSILGAPERLRPSSVNACAKTCGNRCEQHPFADAASPVWATLSPAAGHDTGRWQV